MAADLESNTADRTEVSCLGLSCSAGRTLEVVNVLTVPQHFHFCDIQKKNFLGEFAIQEVAAQHPPTSYHFGPDIELGANSRTDSRHMKRKAWRSLEER